MPTSRLKTLAPATLDGNQLRLYESVANSPRSQNPLFKKFGFREDNSLSGPFDPWLRSPELGLIFEQAGMALRDNTTLPDVPREVAVLVVAAAWNAPFEWFVHSMILRKEGLSDAVIKAIALRHPPPIEDPIVLAAHDVAYELVHKRAVTDATYARAIELLGERNLVELVCAVGFYQLVSGILESFKQPVHEDVVGPASRGSAPAAGYDLYEAASTTRAIRRLKPDPIPEDVLKRVLTAATWAPSGANQQPWRVIVVRDSRRKQALANLYRQVWSAYAAAGRERLAAAPEEIRRPADKALAAGDYLAEHLAQVPVVAVFCFNPELLQITDAGLDRPSVVGGASLYPAVQNFLLACRAEGLGATLTTLLCQVEADIVKLLDVPAPWATCATVPVGWPVGGGHGPLARAPMEKMVFSDRFGKALS